MFRHPFIWIQSPDRIDSNWLSTVDCVWDGPQWLKSKQCLKIEIYLELEHLFKVSLGVPDASQIDVVHDLLMLKSQSGDKNASRSQFTAYTQPSIETAGAPYQVSSAEDTFGNTENSQSINCMEAYKRKSFEVREYYRRQTRRY